VRSSVQNRLILTFGLFALAVFGLGGVLFYEEMRTAMEEELGEKLLATGSIVASRISEDQRKLIVALGGEGRAARTVSQMLDQARTASGLHRLYVFDRSRASLADADQKTAGEVYPELEFEQEAVDKVLAGERVVGHLFTGRGGHIYKAAYIPLPAESRVDAALAIVASASFLDAISRMKNGLLFAGAIGLAGSIALSLFMARTIVGPIRKLVASADRISAGNLETSVPDAGHDEIGYLGRTLERMREAVHARERSLRAMLGGVAHEVRNPLGGIELFAGLLKREVAPDSKAEERVDRILQEVHNLEGIIKDFLEYARPTEEPNRREFLVEEIAVEVGQVLDAAISRAGVRLEMNCDDVRLTADPGQIRQVLINLVQNAVQALEQGGRVAVHAERTDGRVRIRVEDDGPGIADDIRSRVFEPFFSTKQQGSGLGLSIAQKLVERNGGTLTIEAGPSGGTVVTLNWLSAGDEA